MMAFGLLSLISWLQSLVLFSNSFVMSMYLKEESSLKSCLTFHQNILTEIAESVLELNEKLRTVEKKLAF